MTRMKSEEGEAGLDDTIGAYIVIIFQLSPAKYGKIVQGNS
jgi:hypothetical protein